MRLLTKKQNAFISFMFGFGLASLIYSHILINKLSSDVDADSIDTAKYGHFGRQEPWNRVHAHGLDKIKNSADSGRGQENRSINTPSTTGIPRTGITEEQLLHAVDANPSLLKKIIAKAKKDNIGTEIDADTNNIEIEIDNDNEKSLLPSSSASADMCSAFNLQSSSASSIWSQHLKDIFFASRHDQDEKNEYVWHDFTAILLNYISPRRLQTSIKTLPSRYWDQVGKVLQIAWDRYQFQQSKAKGVKPRKLNILVMGGSVTMGVFCQNNPVQETSRFTRRNCAWPTRLGQFLNHLFDDIVNVHMITLGGTNTESAIRIWDYALFPSDMSHPDIVIHAYSTNDMHVLSENEAIKRGITLEDMILQVNQDFIRTVLKPPTSCKDRPTPLLLYYDDYIGNEQREILKTNSFGRAASTLSNYYGFGLISYADAVRDLVYGDTDEDWFSPNTWPERQVHPGMGMHISSMWFVAFNLLNIATAYCSGGNVSTGIDGSSEYEPIGGLPALRSTDKLDGEPKPVPLSLPPELNTNTSLDDISSKWQEHIQSMDFDASACDQSDRLIERCIFSWVGGLERKFDKPKHLEERMKPVLVSNKGWVASADNGKLGFEATKSGAAFEMIFLVETLDVQTLNFMVMTSYGEKWEGSKIRVDAFVDRSGKGKAKIPTNTMEIVGFHDRHTSETYNYKLDLEEERAFSKDILRVRITLVGGSTFKFMGMAICDH